MTTIAAPTSMLASTDPGLYACFTAARPAVAARLAAGKALRQQLARRQHGTFARSATFALAYADQTERDHEALTRAARHGRIQVAGEE